MDGESVQLLRSIHFELQGMAEVLRKMAVIQKQMLEHFQKQQEQEKG